MHKYITFLYIIYNLKTKYFIINVYIEWDTFLLFNEYFSQEKKTMIVRVVLNLTTNLLLARKLSIEDIRYLFHNSFILVRFYKHVLSIFQERTHIPTHLHKS